jgi:hypothetical protein
MSSCFTHWKTNCLANRCRELRLNGRPHAPCITFSVDNENKKQRDMKQTLQVLAVAAVAFAVIALGWELCKSARRRRSRSSHLEAVVTQENLATPPPALVPEAKHEPAMAGAAPKESKRNEDKDWCLECMTVWIAGAAFVGLAVYCYFTWGTWREAQIQTVNSSRAWVGLTKDKFTVNVF